jgi:hypothetical protein
MTRSSHERPFRFAALGFALILTVSVLNAGPAALRQETLLEIAPTKTWVGFARVHLEIEDLRQTGEILEGTYQIRVPLLPQQNDTGRLLLRAPDSIDELVNSKATVTGRAVSSSGQVNDVLVLMRPNGVIQIRVITPQRTLRFKSRYASRQG